MLKAVCVAVLLAIASGLVQAGFAQEPFVIVPDNPGFIGIGGGEEAVATTTLNVREGPGTRYAVIDVLRPGQNVIMTGCSGGWCTINHPGASGWVSERYLRRTSASAEIIRPRSKACFYDDTRFRGRSFCVFPGASDRRLSIWGNRIASIEIRGRAPVQACAQPNFRDCKVFDTSVPVLPSWLDQSILSFRVFD
jgi:uncharacterized protein YgiM (DUF1202 family)